jgi:hypothetical protein
MMRQKCSEAICKSDGEEKTGRRAGRDGQESGGRTVRTGRARWVFTP